MAGTETTYQPQVGDYVRKGNGATVYRVWAANDTHASVVKATTAATPTRGCWYAHSLFTQVERPANAATPAPRASRAAAPAVTQDRAAILLVNAATAEGYASEYRELVRIVAARGEDTAELEATLAHHVARAEALRAEAAAS